MYTQFFSLKQSPFSIAPDPRYLFMSERHREALAHLLYGVGGGGGFVLLTGEIGAGKTTVCRCFMEQIPDDCKLAYIFNPKLSVEELLLSICDEFGIGLPAGAISVKGYVDAINGYLLRSHAKAHNNVLIIDEAQNLSAGVLEQLRLLTNLETNERKLLQIILIGQPELRSMLARPELEQLAQRVIARYHLGSLSEAETGSYIGHRLAVAGATAIAPFPRRLLPQIQRLSKGVPRRINLLCDRALLGAYVENTPQVSAKILRNAAAEVFAGETRTSGGVAARPGWPLLAGAVLAGAVLSGAAAWQLLPKAAPGAVKAAAGPAAPVPALALAPPASAKEAPAAALAGAVLGNTSADVALRELAGLWGLALPPGDACLEAGKQDLRCHQSRGGLYELGQLDRPAVLRLRGAAAAGVAAAPSPVAYALLTSLHDGVATLRSGGNDYRVSLAALTAGFDGEFVTLWRAPRGWRDSVTAGERGADVDWLAQRLAQLYGAPAPQQGQPLDADTQRLLLQFQASRNLKADGVAGPKTFIRLVPQVPGQEPHLLATHGAGTVVAGK